MPHRPTFFSFCCGFGSRSRRDDGLPFSLQQNIRLSTLSAAGPGKPEPFLQILLAQRDGTVQSVHPVPAAALRDRGRVAGQALLRLCRCHFFRLLILRHATPSRIRSRPPVQADAHRVSNGRRDRKAVVVHVVFGIVCRLIPLQRSRVQRHGGLERCTPVGLCQLAGQTVTHRCSRRKQQHIIRHHGVRPIVHDDLLLQQPLVLLQHHPTVDPRQRGVCRRANLETPYVSDELESLLRFLLHVVDVELVLVQHEFLADLHLSVRCPSALQLLANVRDRQRVEQTERGTQG